MRRAIGDGSFELSGDAQTMASIMIASADTRPAPRRIALGSHAYEAIRAALTGRIAELDAQKALACSADRQA